MTRVIHIFVKIIDASIFQVINNFTDIF